MNLIPAIDLLDGRCVRLMHGNFADVTYYDDKPLDLAAKYQAQGAPWLHVVDLEASRDGDAADTTPLFKLLELAPQSVQTGGGVRDGGDIEARLNAGASRVVVGSRCATEPDRFLDWLERFGTDQVVAALDVQIDKTGVPWPRIFGWTEEAPNTLWQMLDRFVDGGLRHVLITDISRDGALSGPNTSLYREVLNRYPSLQLQASGGVSRIDDLLELQQLGASAGIVGKALLENAFTVSHAIKALG